MSNKAIQFDTKRLNEIPIEDVLEALRVERIGNSKKFRCFNDGAHKAGDKSASLSIHPKDNYCNCFGCNAGGGPVTLVTFKMGGDFIEACKWLHEAFNIPYLSGENSVSTFQPEKQKPREIEYLSFDKNRAVHAVDLNKWLPVYNKLSDEQRLKLVYTYIYRYALSTNQDSKNSYHSGRGIDIDHPMLKTIGFLSPSEIKGLALKLEQLFPKEDLIRFNLFSPMDQDFYPGSWKYWSKTGFCVAPSMDLYSDMCNGFMLRNTDQNLDKKKPKEIQVTRPDISLPLPFGLTRELLLSDPSIPIYGNEGYIDGLSMGKEKLFIAATGVHGLKEKVFGLLKGKTFVLAYDMDNAGIRATRGYSTVTVKRHSSSDKNRISTKYFLNTEKGKALKERYSALLKAYTSLSPTVRSYPGLVDSMPKAGVHVSVLSWDTKINKNKFVTDINEILKEYRKAYHSDLTGRGVEQAVNDLRTLYEKGEPVRQLCLSG